MDQLQRNAGSAGLLAAALLVVGFGMFSSSGFDPSVTDPAKVLALIAGLGRRWSLMMTVFAVALGAGMLFTVGLVGRLREKTPTRAAGALYFVIIGLAFHGVDTGILWRSGQSLAALAVADATAAAHAWIAADAIAQGARSIGNGFIGVGLLAAGSAILATRALSPLSGWFGVGAGAFNLLLAVFPASMPIFMARILLLFLWLGRAGSELRRG